MRRCCICKKKNLPQNGSFFLVPKEEQRREKWSEICGIELKKTAKICVDHFLPSQIRTCGSRMTLLPSAVPIARPNQENEIQINEMKISFPVKPVENLAFGKERDESVQTLENLQEEPIIDVSVIKSLCSENSTQTNTRICGLVEALELSNGFHLNCFYCSEAFPLEKWKDFASHLREKHFEIEEGFKTCKHIFEDHDYAIGCTSPTRVEIVINTVVPDTESRMSLLVDPLESSSSTPESDNSSIIHESEPVSNNLHISTSLNRTETEIPILAKTIELNNCKQMENNSKQTSNIITLSSLLKETGVDERHVEVLEECKWESIEIVQQNTTEISFEYTPRDIINSLLDNMKNYPVLWQFDELPYNENFYEAVEDLCKIINDKWSLNIDHLKMRRSINRILRFYCYLFPNDNVENIDQFTHYYDKCATFLPASLNEIAYARCSQCYICFRNDFDLKSHLLEEYKYLQWPYKCVKCKECFMESDEYDFHMCLPHYDENFRCEQCNKTFFRRNKYNVHVADFHTKEGEYKCNICDKVFKNRVYLKNHKVIHGEKKHKCHLCPNSYYNKAKLNLHLKLHRREYDFMCEFCGKKVFSQSTLKQHMKKHTGEKITCNICNLQLRKSSLKQHLQLLHVAYEGTIETTVKGRHVNYRRLIKSSPFRRRRKCIGKNFDCKICKMRFENDESVIKHNEELHPDIPQWSCKMCIMDFSLKRSLKRHYRRKHNLEQIQVCKLVDENVDLNEVYDKEHLYNSTKMLDSKSGDNKRKSIVKRSIKSGLLTEEEYVLEEKIVSSKIQVEIMKDDDDIIATDAFFTELLEEF